MRSPQRRRRDQQAKEVSQRISSWGRQGNNAERASSDLSVSGLLVIANIFKGGVFPALIAALECARRPSHKSMNDSSSTLQQQISRVSESGRADASVLVCSVPLRVVDGQGAHLRHALKGGGDKLKGGCGNRKSFERQNLHLRQLFSMILRKQILWERSVGVRCRIRLGRNGCSVVTSIMSTVSLCPCTTSMWNGFLVRS